MSGKESEQALAERVVAAMMANDAFSRWLGVTVEESAGNRLAFYRVTVRRQDASIVALFRGTVYKTKTDFFAATSGVVEGE